MKLGYTEFSFAYSFTENLIRSSSTGPSSAPVFPNLFQEGRLGYDVHIGLPAQPLFFQYKLPELMKKNSAKEVSQYSLPGFKTPFFRMSLMRRDLSSQHELLVDLDAKIPNSVYYASPEMPGVGTFNDAYNLAQVHRNSVLFSPGDIGLLPDDKGHVVSYKQGAGFGWYCSEPRKVKASRIEDMFGKEKTPFVDDPQFRTLGDATESIRQTLKEIVPPRLWSFENDIRQRVQARTSGIPDRPPLDDQTREATESLLVVREIARVGVGAELVIAQPRK